MTEQSQTPKLDRSKTGKAKTETKTETRTRLSPASGEDYVLEDQIGHVIRRAHQRATAIFMEEIGPARLTPTQYAALVKIQDLGEVSQNRLGRLTAMDPATIKGVVQRLRDRGLVSSSRDPTNRRRVVLALTAEGSKVVAQSIPKGRAITAATLAPLSKDERQHLLGLLRRLA